MPEAPLEIDTKTLSLLPLLQKPVVVVDFYGEWCGPCKKLGEELDKLAKDPEIQKSIQICKFNVDIPKSQSKEIQENHSRLLASYQIQAVPTILIFKGGEVFDTIRGVPSPEALKARLLEATSKKKCCSASRSAEQGESPNP